jgi:hypothetical protein
MTTITHDAPHMTTQRFRASFVLVYVAAGILTLLIWAGAGFSH